MTSSEARHKVDEPIVFLCNICDRENAATLDQLTREAPTCSKCRSNVRLRSVVQILTTELFGSSLRLSEVPSSPELRGLGMSCWEGYADRLARRLSYRNTFYHQEPKFDVTRPDPSLEGIFDFVISSDVFEHVDPPVAAAFLNTRKLLKPEGVFIFSVPFSEHRGQPEPTVEHFPDLHDYQIEEVEGRFRLRNVTREGELQLFDNLVFHGGPGSTLEMRSFSGWSVLAELNAAGFKDITFYSGSDLRHGIYWANKWSMPLAARITSSLARCARG